ncbi:MAG TPA: 50S ribosomal protein L25/general stress protein Ctc [Longimicrobiales bacterium]|nr:50S ribosomal protein L25/general stress protein Ctc [Longimicrobiales bacterium]
MNATLSAEKRTETGKGAARQLRASGRIPAIVYGQGDEGLSVSLDEHETDLLFHRISVDNTIVNIAVDGEKEPISTLIREIQTHPFKSSILHVDFYRIQQGVEVEVEIPIEIEGTPIGVKDSGGVLQLVIHDLAVACIPSKIPDSITIDVSGLDIGDAIHVYDIDMPEGVRALVDEERTLVTVNLPRQEIEEDEAEADEMEVEVIGEGDELAEGEAAEGEDGASAEGDEPEG